MTSPRKKTATAEELIAQLAADPEYQAARAAQHQRTAEIIPAEQPLLGELQAAAFSAAAIDELKQRYAPLPPAAVRILCVGFLVSPNQPFRTWLFAASRT